MQSTVDSSLFRSCRIRKCDTGGPPSLEGRTDVRQSQLYVIGIVVAERVHLFDDIGSQDGHARQAEIT